MSEQVVTLTKIYELLQEHSARFDRMDQRFDGIDRRFEAVDLRFDKVDQRFDGIDRRFEGSDKRVDGLESRLDRMESVQSKIALRLLSVETILNHHSTLLQSLGLRVDSLHGLVEELERRTGRIDQEYVMITEALRRLEKRFDQIDALRLNERIAALEARLLALETPQA
jgi:archaellum component FlaC